MFAAYRIDGHSTLHQHCDLQNNVMYLGLPDTECAGIDDTDIA